MQIAGLMPIDGVRHLRPGTTVDGFSLLHYDQGRLICVESVNAPADHIAARKLLEVGASPSPERACDPGVSLKSFL